MTDPADAPEIPPISPLVAQIISANAAQTAAITNQVIDNLTHSAETAWATVDAIRDQILILLGARYAPSETAIRTALCPSDQLVDRYRPDKVN